MGFAFELAMAAASVVALTIAMMVIERWFAKHPSRYSGFAEAVSLVLVVSTMAVFAWILLETMRFVADELLAFALALGIFIGLVVLTYLPFRSRIHSRAS